MVKAVEVYVSPGGGFNDMYSRRCVSYTLEVIEEIENFLSSFCVCLPWEVEESVVAVM